MFHCQSQPVYSAAYPGNILKTQYQQNRDSSQTQSLVNTPSQPYFEVESDQSELDVWRRNAANGPQRPSEGPAQLILGLFTPTPTYNPHPKLWEGLDPHHQAIMSRSQQLTQAHHHQQYYTVSPSATSPPSQSFPEYHSQTPYQQNPNYPSSISSNDPLMTQEEADLKRLRNTAASARFRAKKKRREQSLERSSREKKEKLAALETRIRDLEAENQWLKDLIMEKNDIKTDAERVRARFGKGKDGREGKEVVDRDRKGVERKDGVGT